LERLPKEILPASMSLFITAIPALLAACRENCDCTAARILRKLADDLIGFARKDLEAKARLKGVG